MESAGIIGMVLWGIVSMSIPIATLIIAILIYGKVKKIEKNISG